MKTLEPEKTYILPEGTLIHVRWDEQAECPLWGRGIPVYAYREPRLGRSIYSAEPVDDVLLTFKQFYEYWGDHEKARDLTLRYYRIFRPEEAEYATQLRLGSWQGYGQGDWLEYAYMSEYDLEEEFNLYLQGDVSLVKVIYPDGEEDYHLEIISEFGQVTGEDINLDISHAREAEISVTYSYS